MDADPAAPERHLWRRSPTTPPPARGHSVAGDAQQPLGHGIPARRPHAVHPARRQYGHRQCCGASRPPTSIRHCPISPRPDKAGCSMSRSIPTGRQQQHTRIYWTFSETGSGGLVPPWRVASERRHSDHQQRPGHLPANAQGRWRWSLRLAPRVSQRQDADGDARRTANR